MNRRTFISRFAGLSAAGVLATIWPALLGISSALGQDVDTNAILNAPEAPTPGSKGGPPPSLAALKPLNAFEGTAELPASPAVGIWDRNGELVYIGPYSEGAVCSSDNSFVEPIVEAVLAGRTVRATHSLAVACFCDWQR